MLIPRKDGVRHFQLATATELLARERSKLLLYGPIDESNGGPFSAFQIMDDIEYLTLEQPNNPIRLEVFSPGGSVPLGLALIDKMDASSCDIWTVGAGEAYSMAAVILACGKKGRRFIYPHCKVMLHMPSSMFQGDARQLEVHNKQMQETKEILAGIFAERCGQDKQKVLKDMELDFFMTAQQAKDYGLVDHILDKDNGFMHLLHDR